MSFSDKDFELEQFRARMLRQTDEEAHKLAPAVRTDTAAWEQEEQTANGQEKSSRVILHRPSELPAKPISWRVESIFPMGC